jgi:hypothetical protein
MPTTPNLQLPYPAVGDPADVPTDMNELATALDGLIHRATYGTTPPASPVDGDEWILPVDTTNGIMWRFRYRAASASAYKWEFIGGPALRADVPGNDTSTANTGAYIDTTTVGPRVNVPRAGDYDFLGGLFFYHSAANAGVTTAICLAAGTTPFGNPAANVASLAGFGYDGGNPAGRILGAAANNEYRMRYLFNTAGTLTVGRRWVMFWPVRVS